MVADRTVPALVHVMTADLGDSAHGSSAAKGGRQGQQGQQHAPKGGGGFYGGASSGARGAGPGAVVPRRRAAAAPPAIPDDVSRRPGIDGGSPASAVRLASLAALTLQTLMNAEDADGAVKLSIVDTIIRAVRHEV